MKKKSFCFFFLPILFGLVFSLLIPALNAEKSRMNEGEQPDLFQNVLTIHEIQKEVERISRDEEALRQGLDQLVKQIQAQESRSGQLREEAGQIAKALYMGDHVDLLFLLLQSKDLGEAIMRYEYMSAILSKKQEVLLSYRREDEKLQKLKAEQQKKASQMEEIRLHLLAEERLLTALEKELGDSLKNQPDAAKMKLLIERFIRDWDENGVATFEAFLSEISTLTKEMPSAFKDQVQFSFTGASLTLTDEEITTFLRKASSRFQNFTLHIHEKDLTFFGEYEGRTLTLTGHYEMGDNLLAFRIDQLIYNGYRLPAETARYLDERYDLGLYMDQVRAGVKLKESIQEEGKLTLRFSLSF